MEKQQWQKFRDELLHLHKALLHFQQRQYEGTHGKVASPQVLLGLVMENPDFAWLRQISELIVSIDELMESKEPVSPQKYADLLTYCKKLLQPKADGNTFEKNYYHAIHQEPGVAIQHAKTQKKLLEISG